MGLRLELVRQMLRPGARLRRDLRRIQGGQLRRDARLHPHVHDAVVHPDELAEDLAGDRADQRARHWLPGRADPAEVALQRAGHGRGTGGDPESERLVAIDGPVRYQLGVVRVRIGVGDRGDRVRGLVQGLHTTPDGGPTSGAGRWSMKMSALTAT